MENFLHCNMCGVSARFKQTMKFFLTNCEHVLCESCRAKEACPVCHNKCNELQITPELPQNLKGILFDCDPLSSIQECARVMEFREAQLATFQEFSYKSLFKYEEMKMRHLKLIEEYKKLKEIHCKLIGEYKKLKQHNDWLKQNAPGHSKPPVLKNMVDSGIQSRSQFQFPTPKLPPKMVTPQNNFKFFDPPTAVSPLQRVRPSKYSGYRRPSPQFSGSSVSSMGTPASIVTPSSSTQNRFSLSEQNITRATPQPSPQVDIQNLDIGSWHASRPKKPF